MEILSTQPSEHAGQMTKCVDYLFGKLFTANLNPRQPTSCYITVLWATFLLTNWNVPKEFKPT